MSRVISMEFPAQFLVNFCASDASRGSHEGKYRKPLRRDVLLVLSFHGLFHPYF